MPMDSILRVGEAVKKKRPVGTPRGVGRGGAERSLACGRMPAVLAHSHLI